MTDVKTKPAPFKTVKGWSTKYALTKGIQFCEIRSSSAPDSNYVYTLGGKSGMGIQLVIGKTFFTTIEGARANARLQVSRKIRGLKKQLARLEELERSPFVSDEELI